MTSQSLRWEGDALTARMRAAQKQGVNKTMSNCVIHAKTNHTWKNQTGDLEGTIQIAEFAREDGAGIVGTWGSKAGEKGLNYALIHELGGVIVPVRAKFLKIPQPDGSFRFVKSVTIPARPYLRPAADSEYPNLVALIRHYFEKGAGSGASQGGVSDA